MLDLIEKKEKDKATNKKTIDYILETGRDGKPKLTKLGQRVLCGLAILFFLLFLITFLFKKEEEDDPSLEDPSYN